MTPKETTAAWKRLFEDAFPSLEQLLREIAYDGFETYVDYVKYGDLFEPCAVSYTPIERQLKV